jgi:hypothetical protein
VLQQIANLVHAGRLEEAVAETEPESAEWKP